MHCKAYKNKVDGDVCTHIQRERRREIERGRGRERERGREGERALDLTQASLEETIDIYTYVASLSRTRPVYTAHT